MIKDLLQEGFVLKSKGYYKHAIEAFYKALDYDNNSSELLLEIADLYFLMGEEERALSYIEKILESNPKHINSLELLEKIFISKNSLKNAEQVIKNMFEITNSDYHLEKLLSIINKQKEFTRTISFEQHCKNSQHFYELAHAYLFNSNIEKAEASINKALELENNTKNLILKSKIAFKQGRIEDAYNIINSIEIDSNDSEILNFAGLVMQYMGEYSRAVNLFKNAIAFSPKNDEYYYNCASTYFKMQEKNIAKKYYNLAIALSPDNANYRFALANLYYSEKNYKRAMEELQADFYEANLLKAIILYDTGYLALAQKQLKTLLKEQPNDNIAIEYYQRIQEELRI